MKKKTKKTEDELLNDLIAALRKAGTICGTGDEMAELRAAAKARAAERKQSCR